MSKHELRLSFFVAVGCKNEKSRELGRTKLCKDSDMCADN